MADDYSISQLFPVSELPDRLPRLPGGGRVAMSTIYRWLGLQRTTGRVLRSVAIGRHRFTTDRWVKEFIEGESVMPVPTATRSPARRARERERAKRQLEAAGI